MPEVYCKECGTEMCLVEHWEHDGEDGSYETYYECPDCGGNEEE